MAYTGDLDSAIIDRMDEALEFPLPSQPERAQIISLYLEQYINAAGTAAGGAGSGAPQGLFSRLTSMFRRGKSSADRITRADGALSGTWSRICNHVDPGL